MTHGGPRAAAGAAAGNALAIEDSRPRGPSCIVQMPPAPRLRDALFLRAAGLVNGRAIGAGCGDC